MIKVYNIINDRVYNIINYRVYNNINDSGFTSNINDKEL